jgi:outer membrane protein assembly factor BamE (lipoprotein component of BamABCDE complex)
MKNIIFLVAIAFITGCASVGTKFDTSKAGQIKIGTTTRAEVMTWFGKPYTTQKMASGGEEIFWMYTEAAIGGITDQRTLKVFVDKDGIVTDFGLQETERPQEKKTAASGPAVKQKPEIGMSQVEIKAMFGTPKSVTRSQDGRVVWKYNNSELRAVPFNFGYTYKEHVFNFGPDGKLTDFTVGDF